MLNISTNTDCGSFANACKKAVLEAPVPASDLSAVSCSELPPVAADVIVDTIDDVRSGAIAPTIADTEVSTQIFLLNYLYVPLLQCC